MINRKLLGLCGCLLLSLGLVGCANNTPTHHAHTHHIASVTHKSIMRDPISYKKSSETKPYPTHVSVNDRIVVSLKDQRAFLQEPYRNSFKTIYTFYISSGQNTLHRRTPKGVYHINQYRSYWFYSPVEHEGARNAVGWKGALYLFHETPSNKQGQIKKSVAKELGKKGSSYGCIHLSIPDSIWFFHHIPGGMTVIIK